jgi:hypothetical protein
MAGGAAAGPRLDMERSATMSKKSLWILVAVLAVLGLALRATRTGGPAAKAPAAAEPLLRVDFATLAAIQLEEGGSATRLAPVAGRWCVAGLGNAPADLDRLRGLIGELDEARRGQLADPGAERLAEYGLAEEGAPPPLKITLEHGGGTTVLRLGRTREPRRQEDLWGPPPGRYVRVDDGPVWLLKDDFTYAGADSDSWWDRRILEVDPEAVTRIEVVAPGEEYRLARGEEESWLFEGEAGENPPDPDSAARLAEALDGLVAERMLEWSAEEREAAFAEPRRHVAEADGIRYQVELGAERPEDGGGRPVRIEVSALPEADDAARARAETAHQRAGGRIYLLPAYLANNLARAKEDVRRPPEPEAGWEELDDAEADEDVPPWPEGEWEGEDPEPAEDAPDLPEDEAAAGDP